MMLARNFAAAAPVSRASASRRVAVKALPFNISLPKFNARDEEEEEDVPETKGSPFSLPFDLPFTRSSTVSAPAPAPAKKVAPKKAAVKVPIVSKAKKGYVYEVSGKGSLQDNDFSTIEIRRPIGGKLRPTEVIDLNQIKPSLWERWGSGKA